MPFSPVTRAVGNGSTFEVLGEQVVYEWRQEFVVALAGVVGPDRPDG